MKKTLLDMARCPCTTLGCRFNRRLLWRYATAGDAPQMNPSQSLASFVSPFSFTFCSLRNSRKRTWRAGPKLTVVSCSRAGRGQGRKRERNHRSIRGSLRGSIDIMLLYQYACACGQPVISGLPLQHAQGALLLSCELRRLNRWWCLRRWWCLNRCRLNRLWLALWSSRLSRHVLLRFVFARRGPAPPFRFRRRSVWCSVWRSVHLLRLLRLRLLRRRLLFGRLHLIIRGQDITRTTKTTREAGRRCRPGRSGGSACASG